MGSGGMAMGDSGWGLCGWCRGLGGRGGRRGVGAGGGGGGGGGGGVGEGKQSRFQQLLFNRSVGGADEATGGGDKTRFYGRV